MLATLVAAGAFAEFSAADDWGCWEPYAAMPNRAGVCGRVGDAFALRPSVAGKGIPGAEWEEFLQRLDQHWRTKGGGYRPLFQDDAEPGAVGVVAEQLPDTQDPGPKHYRFFLVIETLCKAMPRADAGQQQELSEKLSDLVRHYVEEWWRWRRGGKEPRGRPGFPVYGLPDYCRVMAEATRLARPERSAFAEVLYDQFAWNHEQAAPDVQMDHLKAMVAYLPWVPMLLEGRDREAMIGRAAAFYDRVIRCENTFSADGAIIHHGIWHYAYASYSLTSFLDNLVRWHRSGLYLSATSRSHLRRAALVAAILSDNVARVVPFNVEGRSGGMPGIGGMTDHLLRTAALLGADDSPETIWMPAAAVLKAIEPRAAMEPEFADVVASRKPLMGAWPVNRGGALIVRQPGWMAVVGGLSAVTGKHEIYSWTQSNNYSIFVRRGGMAIVTDEGNAREPGLGYGLEGGFDWSLIPGATTELRPADQLFSRRHNTFITNSGMAAACAVDGAGTWALDQVVGPGPSFRTSLHVARGRLTSVTTSVRADQPQAARPRVSGIPPSPPTPNIGTTLFQWPVALVHDENEPASKSKPAMRRHAGGGVTVRDRYGNAYCLHPRSEGRLQTDRRRQSQVLIWDRYLREGMASPIDWSRWTVDAMPLERFDLSDLADKYVPREGWFDVAGIVHGRRQNDTLRATVYTVLPLASDDDVAAFADVLGTPAAPVEVLVVNDAHHVVRHPQQGTTTVAVFDPTRPLPTVLPIGSVSLPCTVTLVDKGSELQVAAAWITPASGEPLVLALRQPAPVQVECGDVTIEDFRLSLTRANMLPWRGTIGVEQDASTPQ